MRMCVLRGKKWSFFGKFGVLCFLATSVLRFAVLPNYRRIKVNLFQSTVKFQIATSHLFCIENQVTGFYMMCNWAEMGYISSFALSHNITAKFNFLSFYSPQKKKVIKSFSLSIVPWKQKETKTSRLFLVGLVREKGLLNNFVMSKKDMNIFGHCQFSERGLSKFWQN